MKTLTTLLKKMMLAGLVPMFFLACQKEVAERNAAPAEKLVVTDLHMSESKLTLLQGNAVCRAITMNWVSNATVTANRVQYTIEAAIDGIGFEEKIELATTDAPSIQFKVSELNKMLSRLVLPGTTAMINVRVRAEAASRTMEPVYTESVALQVTTYLDYVEYSYPKFIKVPGNYQGWNLTTAPQIVATAEGEYEGFLNFTTPYSQFLLVKGTQWSPANTYTNIGDSKFGFGGDILGVTEGAGTYLVKASTNTNKWNCVKINTWGIHGTAVPATGNADPVMSYDDVNKVYAIVLNLQKGTFRFRANNKEGVSMGYSMNNGYKVPNANGEAFTIEHAGVYELKLDLKLAGNYACTVVKVPQHYAPSWKK